MAPRGHAPATLTPDPRRGRDARSSCRSGRTRRSRRCRPDDIRDGRRLDHPLEHLPPLPAARPRADRAPRRAAPVHGLGSADPDRLGRVPGRLARRPAGRRRGRGDVPQPPRRLDPHVHAGASRSRSRRRSAPTSPSPSTSRSSRSSPRAVVADATERTHRWAERSLAAHDRAGPGAVRDRPGRPGPGPARRVDPVHRRACRSTGSASAGWPATRRRASATRRSTWRCRCWRTIRGRAT